MNIFFTALHSPITPRLIERIAPLILVVVLWTVTLKGFALWYAARGRQKWWFIALLILNTLGILEIVYLIWFRLRNDVREAPLSEPPTAS